MLRNLIIWLLMGAIAGWLAGYIMKGKGFGFVGNIVVGIIGSIIGGALLGGFFSSLGFIGTLLTSVIGAVILLLLVNFINNQR